MSEWKAFAAVAVDWLGMPVEAIPLYSSNSKWSKKAEMIIEFVLETGNFGHNRERETHDSYMGGKLASAFRKLAPYENISNR